MPPRSLILHRRGFTAVLHHRGVTAVIVLVRAALLRRTFPQRGVQPQAVPATHPPLTGVESDRVRSAQPHARPQDVAEVWLKTGKPKLLFT